MPTAPQPETTSWSIRRRRMNNTRRRSRHWPTAVSWLHGNPTMKTLPAAATRPAIPSAPACSTSTARLPATTSSSIRRREALKSSPRLRRLPTAVSWRRGNPTMASVATGRLPPFARRCSIRRCSMALPGRISGRAATLPTRSLAMPVPTRCRASAATTRSRAAAAATRSRAAPAMTGSTAGPAMIGSTAVQATMRLGSSVLSRATRFRTSETGSRSRVRTGPTR